MVRDDRPDAQVGRVRYSFDPIDFHRGDTEISVIAAKIGVAHGTVQKWRERGMDEENADRVATALGLHPWQLWPEMLAVATAPVMRECSCGEFFVLTRPEKRWCNAACRKADPEVKAKEAAWMRERYREDAEHRSAKLAANRAYKAEARLAIRASERRRRAEKRDEINAYKRAWRARQRERVA